MATHSSVLAWRIPWIGEPGGLPSMESHRVGHEWSNLAAAAELTKNVVLVSGVQFSSVAQSCPTPRPHESQHTRPPCPSPTPRVHSDSRPSSPWCHPAISSSVIPFSSCPQSLPASESFPMSQLFQWGGQSTGVSAFSIIPSKEIPGLISFRMDWLELLAVQGTLKSLLQHHKCINSSPLSLLYGPTLTSIRDY